MSKVLSGKLDALVNIARSQHNKVAFVDPATASGGGGAPPPGDPAAAGGGAPPPADPAAMGGGGGPDIQMMITSAVQQAMQGMGGGMGGAGGEGGMLKPKIDVNVEIMQIKNLLAKIADALGVPIPAQDMVATPEKLTAMAQGQNVATPMGGGAGGAGGGGGGIGGIEPMQGIGGGSAKTSEYGEPAGSVRMLQLSDRASALAAVMSRR